MLSHLQTLYHHVYNTNYLPTNEEENEIRAILRDPEKEIQMIDHEISALRARRDELQHAVEPLRILLSPCRKLPDEILSEIFAQCLPEGPPSPSTKEAPLLLTLICHNWRETALRDPRIWSALCITIPKPKNVTNSGHGDTEEWLRPQMEGVMLWLERSGSLPLNLALKPAGDSWAILDFYQRSSGVVGFQDPYLEFMQMLANQSPRWKHLSLSHLPPPIFEPFRTLGVTDLPLLETVVETASLQEVVPTGHLDVFASNSPITSILQRSPALHTLRTELIQGSDLSRIFLPLSQLTTLQVGFLDSVDGFDILRQLSMLCSSLLACTLEFSLQRRTEDLIPTSRSAMEWTHLQELCIRFSGKGDQNSYREEIRRTFEAISTPSLNRLKITTPYQCLADDTNYHATLESVPPFHDLIQRSHCQLLSLDINTILGPKFYETLQILPNLTSLTVRRLTRISTTYSSTPELNPEETVQLNAIIQGLIPSQGHVTCPKLQHIRIGDLFVAEAASFLGLLSARAQLVSNLRTFTATFGELTKPGIEELVSVQQEARSTKLAVLIRLEYLTEIPSRCRDCSRTYSRDDRMAVLTT
ncbi:hypothetical protein V5O48_015851 [Marasmius crinis-equi]|uniref:F-box domain-containing protein n=1 Tax=Marasmius crinis-equi TaxID=585013 RepID=A0ABR3ETC7_9AGAR